MALPLSTFQLKALKLKILSAGTVGAHGGWDCAYREGHLLRHPYASRPSDLFERTLLQPCPFCGCAQSVALTDTARENLLDPRAWVFQLVRCKPRSAKGASLFEKIPPDSARFRPIPPNSGCGAQVLGLTPPRKQPKPGTDGAVWMPWLPNN